MVDLDKSIEMSEVGVVTLESFINLYVCNTLLLPIH